MTFTFVSSALVDHYGDVPTCVFLIIALIIGSILTALIREDLRRQAAAKHPSTAGLSPRL